MNNSSTGAAQPTRQPEALLGTPTNVSEPAFEFLLSSILHWVEQQCRSEIAKTKLNSSEHEKQDIKEEDVDKQQSDLVMVAEHSAAKMEKIGYDVGYRLSERLAQSKSLTPPTNNNKPPTAAAVQLEAVKFICKEFWTEVYRKQIDKLQTNHRGVFVLKDLDFKWLKRLPGDQDLARIMAIKILAFPCGLIRGSLANLGIVAVVSCDFLADGKNMSACSFNIKIKSS